jgi:hypothetical protein
MGVARTPLRHFINSCAREFTVIISVKQVMQGVAVLAFVSALAACGGGGSATIGGTVTGLRAGASVTLQDNNIDNLTIAGDQGFTFVTSIPANATYNVSVLTQPVGQSCQVGNASGVIDAAADDVTIVTVTCALASSVGGTVAGLAAGNSVFLALQNGQLLAIAANGTFAFPGLLASGSSYSVAISAQPAQQTCVLTNASGVVASGAMALVSVSCS